MYIYAFGSICRGEFDEVSDIDLLVIKNNDEQELFNVEKFSVYEMNRINQLWVEGNPFAWHLFREAKLIFTSDGVDIIEKLGSPKKYKNLENDLNKFSELYFSSLNSLTFNDSKIFDLSMIFLAIRNFASCYSLGVLSEFNFSRHSALHLTRNRLEINSNCYSILERARIMSTRGIGNYISQEEIEIVMKEIDKISNWFQKLKQINYERV